MQKIYKVKAFAEAVGVSAKTVRRWDRQGVFPARRHPNSHRYYTNDDLRIALDLDAGAGKVVSSKKPDAPRERVSIPPASR